MLWGFAPHGHEVRIRPGLVQYAFEVSHAATPPQLNLDDPACQQVFFAHDFGNSYDPFREVQLLIDGQLAGIAWLFPVLLTGGVDPGAWRSIIGIEVSELAAFIPDRLGYDASARDGIGRMGENWWVSGSLPIWLGDTVERTTARDFVRAVLPSSFNFCPAMGSADQRMGR
ncbi:hypothetical protein F4779DRAFT_620036 [Xylariaceae sp. FL0662B]|nr:hypothetical protein F4779DRAFT_620036 [Xylariaceae sp. FL0662B]